MNVTPNYPASNPVAVNPILTIRDLHVEIHTGPQIEDGPNRGLTSHG